MIEFNHEDKTVDVSEIERLMDIYDKDGVFATRSRYHQSYYAHYIKLISDGHVMTFRDTRKGFLKGFCSWIIVDKKSKKDINKTRWLLPNNINEGNILYIDTCLTTESMMIRTIKKNLTVRFKDKVEKVFWFNVDRGKCFTKNIKGGVPCPTVVG